MGQGESKQPVVGFSPSGFLVTQEEMNEIITSCTEHAAGLQAASTLTEEQQKTLRKRCQVMYALVDGVKLDALLNYNKWKDKFELLQNQVKASEEIPAQVLSILMLWYGLPSALKDVDLDDLFKKIPDEKNAITNFADKTGLSVMMKLGKGVYTACKQGRRTFLENLDDGMTEIQRLLTQPTPQEQHELYQLLNHDIAENDLVFHKLRLAMKGRLDAMIAGHCFAATGWYFSYTPNPMKSKEPTLKVGMFATVWTEYKCQCIVEEGVNLSEELFWQMVPDKPGRTKRIEGEHGQFKVHYDLYR
ncbi:unnamed protein product [Cladocopium goreaui]|uniref:Uncharacterized protein n=1 Tax=Cladocopium goreaui TaxID=2562237 RepID=A0A9P1BJR4_9DINO|nr:unnamed protein product [Cladocopium goreaui]